MHHAVYVQTVFSAIQELESRHFVRRGFDKTTQKTEWRSPHGDYAEIIVEGPLQRVRIDVDQFNGSPFMGFNILIGGPYMNGRETAEPTETETPTSGPGSPAYEQAWQDLEEAYQESRDAPTPPEPDSGDKK